MTRLLSIFVLFLICTISQAATEGDQAAVFAAQGSDALEKRDYKSAVKYLDEAIKLSPSSSKLVYLWRGQALAGSGDHRKAISDFMVVFADQTTPPVFCAEVLRNIALSHEALGDYPAALNDYESALKLNPESQAVLNDFAWFLATTSKEDLRDGKRSLTLAQEAVKFDETNPAVLDTLATAYAATGDYKSAVSTLEKALALAGNGPITSALNAHMDLYKASKPLITPPVSPSPKETKQDAVAKP